ncbi:ABC transporter permease [Bacillus massiliigorillae]|uniref:ABC transporter permease n=1 Tax=Bacillus massiliigorillae TaxID=1243664 RepID=UPI00039D3843|nr:ABC transporter permease [Bacillus massiliigorillae]
MFLALKELKHGKLRFLMIGIILILISWLVFILSGLGNGLNTLSAAVFKNMDAQYIAFEDGSRASLSRSIIGEEQIAKLEKQKDVQAAAPIGNKMATIQKEKSTKDEDKVDVAIIGVNPGTFVEPKIIEGSALSEKNSTNIIANIALKDKGFKIGDTVRIEGSHEKMKIVGFVENQSYNHVSAVFTTMDKWRAINFAAPGSDNGVQNPVNGIALKGENINPDSINKHLDSTEVVTKSEAIQGMPGYKEENGTITMMLAFLLAISTFVIAVFFYVLTLQKSNQFGIMKAIGASNGFLGKAIVSQVFVLSLFSILVGMGLAYGVAAVLPKEVPFLLDIKLVMIYGLVLLVVSLLSSLLSVRKITKIDPLQAIGRVE